MNVNFWFQRFSYLFYNTGINIHYLRRAWVQACQARHQSKASFCMRLICMPDWIELPSLIWPLVALCINEHIEIHFEALLWESCHHFTLKRQETLEMICLVSVPPAVPFYRWGAWGLEMLGGLIDPSHSSSPFELFFSQIALLCVASMWLNWSVYRYFWCFPSLYLL